MPKDQELATKIDPENPDIPVTEEEVPPDDKITSSNKRKKRGQTVSLNPKDNRAFWLTCGCLLALTIIGTVDAIVTRDILEDSQMLESYVEILKYVITTSLGFFFASTIPKKQ